jgi:ribosomal protein S27E
MLNPVNVKYASLKGHNMAKIVKVTCKNCGLIQEAVYSQYGAEFPCIECDAAPVYLVAAR